MKQRTAFRQPKGKKHAPKTTSCKELGAWKNRSKSRTPRDRSDGEREDRQWQGACRSTVQRLVIEEELHHARELDDLAAIETDRFGLGTYYPDHGAALLRRNCYTTPHDEAHKEAPMQHLNENTVPGTPRMPVGSLSQPRPSGRVSKKRPWRLTTQAEEPKLTLLPHPDDAALKYKHPVDPTTRKATRIIPNDPRLTESVDWTIEDLVEDQRLVRNGT